MHMRNQTERHFGVHINYIDGFKFKSQAYEGAALHGLPVLSDEPDPVGTNAGPSTPALLAMAVGHCLSASLIETLRHAGISTISSNTEAVSIVVLNDQGNPRIKEIRVDIKPILPMASGNIQRCINVFENYCTVCQSIRPAIPVYVTVNYTIQTLHSPNA